MELSELPTKQAFHVLDSKSYLVCNVMMRLAGCRQTAASDRFSLVLQWDMS